MHYCSSNDCCFLWCWWWMIATRSRLLLLVPRRRRHPTTIATHLLVHYRLSNDCCYLQCWWWMVATGARLLLLLPDNKKNNKMKEDNQQQRQQHICLSTIVPIIDGMVEDTDSTMELYSVVLMNLEHRFIDLSLKSWNPWNVRGDNDNESNLEIVLIDFGQVVDPHHPHAEALVSRFVASETAFKAFK